MAKKQKPKAIVSTQPIERMLERLGTEAVFGIPRTEGEVQIIPVAEVALGFGYGGGEGGPAVSPAEEGEGSGENGGAAPVEGSGGGGGGGGRAIPRGYLRVAPEGVSYERIPDETRIPLAGILMGAWSVFWVLATVRAVAKAVARVKLKQASS